MAQAQSKNINSSQNTSNSKTSVIAEGTIINGDFKTSENLRVDGIINGDVDCEKKLVFGKNGRVNGKINAAEININGKFTGELITKGNITLGANANAEGKITATNLIMEEGAIFNGNFTINKK